LAQARRLIAQPRAATPIRRFVGPCVLAGLLVGIVAYVVAAVLAPPLPVADTAMESVAPVSGALGVPHSETASGSLNGVGSNAAAAAPTPDLRIANAKRLREATFAPFRGLSGTFGIAVRDLGTGLSVLLNEDLPFQAASLYKLPVMYEVFKQRDDGALNFREEMTIGADDDAMDLGTLPWPIGTRITVGTALERMVTISDNSGAYMLTKRVSSRRINEDVAEIGLRRTTIQSEGLRTSAGDMLRLLELLAQGDAVGPATSAEMVRLMTRQQIRDRIPALMPPDAIVANKTGNLGQASHDVALVYGPRSTFAIALLSDGGTDYEALKLAMAQASRNVYDVVNDPDFGTSPTPLPPMLVADYSTTVKVPAASAPRERPAPRSAGSGAAGAGTSGAGASVPRPTAGTNAAGSALSGAFGATPTGGASNASAPNATAAPAPTRAPTQAAAPTGAPAQQPAPTAESAPAGQPPEGGEPATSQPRAQPAAQPTQRPSRTPAPEPALPAPAPAGPAAAPALTPVVKPSGPTIFAPAPTKTP